MHLYIINCFETNTLICYPLKCMPKYENTLKEAILKMQIWVKINYINIHASSKYLAFPCSDGTRI